MQALDQLNTKLDLLLKRFAASEAENKRLKDMIAVQKKSLDELNARLGSLDKDMVSVHIGNPVDGAEDNENMRRQLDAVIGEIDKILNALND